MAEVVQTTKKKKQIANGKERKICAFFLVRSKILVPREQLRDAQITSHRFARKFRVSNATRETMLFESNVIKQRKWCRRRRCRRQKSSFPLSSTTKI